MISCITIRFRLCFIVLTLVLLVQQIPTTSVAAQNSANEHLAVILILDDSGSMESSDPTDLRYTAAQLLVSLLDEGDAVGAIRFSTTTSQITNGIEIITSPDHQTRLVQQLAPVTPDGYTDVKAAFAEAQRMRADFRQAGYEVVVIFLTDGQPEIPQPYSGYEQEALDVARSVGAPILSIALTKSGQSPFLNQVASQTGGRVILANSATDLLDSYLQILGELKDRTVVGSGTVSASGQVVLPLDPALMPYVDRVSFLVSKPVSANASLITPGGQIISVNDPGVTFAIEDQRFAVYTLSQPASGDWNFELSGSGPVQVRAILYSRLRVHLVSPEGSFEAGQPLSLEVRLVEEQPGQTPVSIIGQASFAAWITLPDGSQESLDQFYDDGTNGDSLAGDGLYTRVYVNTRQPGNYQVRIQGFKGAVPVAYQTQIQGVTFPLPVLDQPVLPRYDIRANTVPIQIHLSGAEVNVLDRGSFIAEITTPSGITVEVPLIFTTDSYSGEYTPTENGAHHIQIKSVDATYQGLPYRHGLETTIDLRLIPTLTVLNIQIGLIPQKAGETSRLNVDLAKQGIPLIVTFSSTSPQPETIMAKLEDMPGFTLLEGGELVVAPNESTLTLHLSADPAMLPQAFQGRLIFTTFEGVDLVGGDVPLDLELVERTVSITLEVSSTASPDSCLVWGPVRLTLIINSTSTQSEQFHVYLENMPGVSLSQETITVQPGANQIELTILPNSGEFASGEYTGQLIIAGVDSGVIVTGDSSYRISFQVEPVWVSCRKPMIFSGAAFLIGFTLLALVVARARRNARPPIVTGTLIHWDKTTPDLTMNVDLTALNKTEVQIGKGSQNDIVINDEALQEVHALILVERDENNELRFTLRPKASIRKGYREYTSDLPLEENTQYQMGNRIFKYIRDLTY